ncbi:hypothetical protein [Runella limosa]|uniref:hypothetical protein n=1 Tax=Runella limosa TaxID=370978 RepID=UPI0003F5375B|nr:hypothetical protein [Runella limosa]
MNTIRENNFETVFWHELGHFVAYTICYEEFKILRVGRIKFFQKKGTDSIDAGIIYGAIPKDQGIDYDRGSIPERITTTLYGCIFESIFTEKDFETCFHSVPALKDKQSFLDESGSYSKKIEHITVKYAANLRFKEYFNQLNFNNFLPFFDDFDEEENQIVYYIEEAEVTKLELILQQFLKEHKSDYLQFLQSVRTIMNWDTKPIPMIYD